MNMKLERPSPAMVVACIALLFSLGPAVYAANTVFSTDIVNGEVMTPDIANGAVTNIKLANGSVDTNNIRLDAVNGDRVQDSSLTGADIAFGSIFGSDIVDATLTGSDVANDSLTTDDIVGVDVNGNLDIVANFVQMGRCRDLVATLGGAREGQVVEMSLRGPLQQGVLIQAVRIPADNDVTIKVCNFTGAALPAIANVAVRLVTFDD